VLDGRIDQCDLRDRAQTWRVDDRTAPLGYLELQALQLLAPREFGREPLRTNASGRLLGVRQQRTLHLFVLCARPARRPARLWGVAKPPRVDEAVPLTAHGASYRQAEARPGPARWGSSVEPKVCGPGVARRHTMRAWPAWCAAPTFPRAPGSVRRAAPSRPRPRKNGSSSACCSSTSSAQRHGPTVPTRRTSATATTSTSMRRGSGSSATAAPSRS